MKISLRRCVDFSTSRRMLSSIPELHRDLISILILLLLPLIFFANVLFTDQALVGDNLARFPPWKAYANEELLQRPTNRTIDIPWGFYPQAVVATEMVRGGQFPLWNPYSMAGAPFVGSRHIANAPSGGLLYPPNLVYILVGPLRGFDLSAFLHLCLAGIFMYLYLRTIELNRISSLIGAVSFQLSGYFLVNLGWPTRISAAAWAPLLFFSFEKYWRERNWGYAILVAFGVGMCLLAGRPIVFAFIILALGFYSAMTFALGISERGLTTAAKTITVVVAAIGLGVLLAAVQLIPGYEASLTSERAYWSYEDLPDTGRSPLSLATALVPDILCNPVDPIWLRCTQVIPAWGEDIPANYARPSIYAGILPLLLGVWALVFKRNRYVLFFAGLAALSLSLFLTFPSIIHRVLCFLPIFRAGRPMEVKVLYALALSVLAAWGSHSLTEEVTRKSRSSMRRMSKIVLAIGVAALAAAIVARSVCAGSDDPSFLREWCLYNSANLACLAALLLASGALLLLRLRRNMEVHLCGFLAILLIAVDLLSFGWKFHPPQRTEDLFFETEATRFLKRDSDVFRIIRMSGGRKPLPPNTAVAYGISDAQEYASLMPDRYREFLNLVEPNLSGERLVRSLGRVESLSSKLLDLLNVKYILANPEVGQELLEYDDAHQDIELVYDDEIKIYENMDVLPRAFVVHDFKVLPDKEDIFTELTSERFDPGAYVILEQEPSRLPMVTDRSATDSSARIVDYTPNKVVIEVDAAADGFLILTDLHYAGWKTFVDSEAQDVYKADYIFRAVELTEGQHTIEFVFDPLSFKLGWTISALTAVMLGLSLVWDSFRRRHSREVI